jgi:hypothetical protein
VGINLCTGNPREPLTVREERVGPRKSRRTSETRRVGCVSHAAVQLSARVVLLSLDEVLWRVVRMRGIDSDGSGGSLPVKLEIDPPAESWCVLVSSGEQQCITEMEPYRGG